MKKRARSIAAVFIAVVGVLTLSSCDDRPSLHDWYTQCLEAGGSWTEDAWGQSCIQPGDETR